MARAADARKKKMAVSYFHHSPPPVTENDENIHNDQKTFYWYKLIITDRETR